ncbi:alpha-2-macroglobulin-like protein 1 isoform X2 [Ascaphus truei]
MVTLPAILHYPSNETVCVQLSSPNSKIELTVSLMTQTGTTVLTTQRYIGEGQLECAKFQVPPPTGAAQEVATIAVSGGSGQSESKKVLIRASQTKMFIQTDKPIYLPGQTMKFRVVRFNKDLIASNEKINLIELQDPKGNRIGQWKNVVPQGGIVDLSYALSSEPLPGVYKINVPDNEPTTATFSVEEYELPRFDLTIDMPAQMTIQQDTLLIIVRAKYTYGKPARGRVTGKMCRRAIPNGGKTDICKPINGETDVHGHFSEQTDTTFFKLKSNGYDNYVDVEVVLEEDGTGVEIKKETSIFISTVITTVSFLGVPSTYRQGLLYRGQMSLTGADGSPMPNEDLILYVNQVRTDDTYTTDKNGIARFSLDTSSWENKYTNLRGQHIPSQPVADTGEVNPTYNEGYTSVSRFYTEGKSQLKIRSDPSSVSCDEDVKLWADFTIEPSEFEAGRNYVEFNYVVMAKGSIVQNARMRHLLSSNKELKGSMAVPLRATAQLGRRATVMLYTVLPNGNLVADSTVFIIETCFPNKVSLQFSEDQTLPGSELNLHMSASPGSLCSLRAVDKSILLLRPDEKRLEDTVDFLQSHFSPEGYPSEVAEFQECSHPVPLISDASRAKRSLPGPMPAHTDTFSIFEDSGMKVLTNWRIREPVECYPTLLLPINTVVVIPEKVDFSNGTLHFITLQSGQAVKPPPRLRKKFPETWMFDLLAMGSSNQVDKRITAPDTITEWHADALCTGGGGLGFSPPASLIVFQPFFIDVILPYSVVRGETCNLKATVFNYMKQCIKVQVSLFQSTDFVLLPCAECTYSFCLCSDPSYTFTWAIRPIELGLIDILITAEALNTNDLCDGQKPVVPQKGQSDTVLKRLLVEPEGMRVEKTHSSLLCALESEEIHLSIPDDTVDGSQTAVVTVTGDVMGTPLNNIGGLLKMPSGCGEQIMINFSPNIAIMVYLKTTGQLTDEIVVKANSYMISGYQKQMANKHPDGSYSAFGIADGSGNTWLTAFIAYSFHEAQEFIFIDSKHIADAVNWLKGKQQPNGSFKNDGQLYHLDLPGGVNDELSLTAYVVIALLKIRNPGYQEIVDNSKAYLEKSLAPETSIYTKAICAYAFTLSGDTEKRQQLLDQLDQLAIKSAKKMYWSQYPDLEDDTVWSNPQPASVETTSYVLLALLSQSEPSPTDLGKAVPGVRWLTSQQKANGEFSSTQDTVVALQALSMYARRTYTPGSSPIITVSSSMGFSGNILVNSENWLLLKQENLPHIPATYTTSVTGNGCAYVQFTLRYNIPQPHIEGKFSLVVKTTPINCPPHPLPSFTLTLDVSYIGSRKVSNMALIEVKLLSGYAAVTQSVNNLLANPVVKRTEISKSAVIIYLNKLDSTLVTLSFEVEQECPVSNLKPALIILYDYYITKERVERSYNAPCM